MKHLMSSFCSALTEYARAISEGRYEDAADLACSVRHSGDLIAVRPEFVKQYHKMHPGIDPRFTLNNASDFLECIALTMNDLPTNQRSNTSS